MKKMRVFLSALVLVFGLSLTANAALIDNGDGTITQTDGGSPTLMWHQYVDYDGYAVGTTWDDAYMWVDNLNNDNFLGYSDWRLPSALESDGSECMGYACGGELGNLYYNELGNMPGGAWWPDENNMGPFTDLTGYFWTSTFDDWGFVYDFNFDDGSQYPSSMPEWGFWSNTMAVRSMDTGSFGGNTGGTGTVPEPGTLLLLGSGMGMAMALRKRLSVSRGA